MKTRFLIILGLVGWSVFGMSPAFAEQASGKPIWETNSDQVCGDKLCSEIEKTSKNDQICINKVWMESKKGKLACVTPSTAEKLVERGWGTMSNKTMENNDQTLVVMAAPSINEEYYQEVFSEIIEYDINAINTIYGKNNIVLLVDDATKHLFEGQIPDDVIRVSNIADIWIRDFGTVDTRTEVKFVYKPQYLTKEDSVWINDSYQNWFDATNLSSKKSDLILDGGNLVFDGKDKAITTVRVFEDNLQYSKSEIDSMLKTSLQVTEIAYLPEEEGDITGHSDGMVMWVESNKLLVNEYQEPFRSQVLSELEESFSDIEIVEIPHILQKELWQDWPSACGYYLNSLVTENYIYVPVYGLDKDQMVLDLIQSHTSKKVVSIDASNVCFMGGSVRCLTWTTDGTNAERILEN